MLQIDDWEIVEFGHQGMLHCATWHHAKGVLCNSSILPVYATTMFGRGHVTKKPANRRNIHTLPEKKKHMQTKHATNNTFLDSFLFDRHNRSGRLLTHVSHDSSPKSVLSPSVDFAGREVRKVGALRRTPTERKKLRVFRWSAT